MMVTSAGFCDQLAQRQVVRVGGLLVQDRVAVEEGAAAAVLADQAQLVAFVQQRGVGEVLGEAPVARQFAGGHLAAVFVDLGDARMQLDARPGIVLIVLGEGRRAWRASNVVSTGSLSLPLQARGPVDGELVGLDFDQFGRDRAGVELVAVRVDQRLRVLGLERAFGDQSLRRTARAGSCACG